MKALPLALLLSVSVTGTGTGCFGWDETPAPKTPTSDAPPAAGDALGAALAGPQRAADNRARDAFRHPRETLGFFGLKEDMTVVELWPGGGWYTEILAPYLAPRGKLYVTGSKVVAERIEKEPNVFGKVDLRRIDVTKDTAIIPEGTADLVLTFRNVHNWLDGGIADKVFEAAFRSLKHGGTFGVVEHRAKPGADEKTMIDTGYVTEELVIGLAKKAGFDLEARSEINANPKDTKDHKGGVWALPPVLTNGDADRAKYVAIGESDRMTLKFKKP